MASKSRPPFTTMRLMSRTRGSSAYATTMAIMMSTAPPASPNGVRDDRNAGSAIDSDPAIEPRARQPRPMPNTKMGDRRNSCDSSPKNTHMSASKHM